MKKLLFKQSISGYGDPTRSGDSSFSFAPDQVAEVEDELANAWVASGVASWAPREPKVAPKAEFAVAKAPEVSKPAAPKVEVKTVVVAPEVTAQPKVEPKVESIPESKTESK